MFPPEKPPPPFPRNLPFQPFTGSPMKTFTRSPAGGCVTVAITRHELSEGSITAESIVVFGIETLLSSSHGQIGVESGNKGDGGPSGFCGFAGCAPARLMAAAANTRFSISTGENKGF